MTGEDRPIRIAVQIDQQHAGYEVLREAAIRAEDAGVDVVFNLDHFFPYAGDPSGSHFASPSWSSSAAGHRSTSGTSRHGSDGEMRVTLRVRSADVTIGSMSKLSPRVDRPAIPAEYGVTKASRFVDWGHIEERFAADRVYWIATVGRDGRPRVRPIDGVYVDGAIYVGGSPETRWVRELADNPHVNVHLDGVDDVIILDGEAEVMTSVGNELAERLAEASNAKFPEYRMTAAVYRSRGAIAIRPRKVISWTDITADPTRFRFDR